MKFTDEQLNGFIALYESEFGEKLSKAEALRQATALISLVKSVYRPMSRKDFKKYTRHLEKSFNSDKIINDTQ